MTRAAKFLAKCVLISVGIWLLLGFGLPVLERSVLAPYPKGYYGIGYVWLEQLRQRFGYETPSEQCASWRRELSAIKKDIAQFSRGASGDDQLTTLQLVLEMEKTKSLLARACP